jgi:Uma2 family endonuclease
MVARPHPVFYSFEEYLQHEEASNTKHEYLDGRIYAMAGGTPEHSGLIASVIIQLGKQLEGTRCRVHMSDLHVRTPTGLATYPDVAVVCGPWERDPAAKRMITNPKLIVEVLSPSTEEYDRGEKFEHYQRIPSLETYVLVGREIVEVFSKTDAGWVCRRYAGKDVADLPSIGARLDVAALYAAAAEPA